MRAKLFSLIAIVFFALSTAQATQPVKHAKPAKQSAPTTMVQVRKEFAHAVYAGSPKWVHTRQPQAMLRAVVVLNIKLGADNLWQASVLRANSDQTEMTERAIESVKRAKVGTIPASLRGELLGDGFMETWLFDRDGSFQVKTLAKPQRRR
jgi:protein TonB